MNRKSFLKISFTFIVFFINKMLFATTIEKEIFFSAYLKGIKLAKAEGQIKIKPNILSIQMFDRDKSAILKSLVTILPQSRTTQNITQKDIKVDCQGGTVM